MVVVSGWWCRGSGVVVVVVAVGGQGKVISGGGWWYGAVQVTACGGSNDTLVARAKPTVRAHLDEMGFGLGYSAGLK